MFIPGNRWGGVSAWSPEDLQSNFLGREFEDKALDYDQGVIAANAWRLLPCIFIPPIPTSEFYNIAKEWDKLLKDAGAISYDNEGKVGQVFRSMIKSDTENFKLDPKKLKTIDQAKAWRETTALWKCMCSGDEPRYVEVKY